MPRGRQDTNDGLVGDYEEMLDFVNSLKQMMRELTECRDDVFEAMVKMGDLGNTDEKTHEFTEGFKNHATQIDDLNDILDKSVKFYNEQADIVRDETETDVSVDVNYRRHR